jgi:hypothetical protein
LYAVPKNGVKKIRRKKYTFLNFKFTVLPKKNSFFMCMKLPPVVRNKRKKRKKYFG